MLLFCLFCFLLLNNNQRRTEHKLSKKDVGNKFFSEFAWSVTRERKQQLLHNEHIPSLPLQCQKQQAECSHHLGKHKHGRVSLTANNASGQKKAGRADKEAI
jgi:hypothetical protein